MPSQETETQEQCPPILFLIFNRPDLTRRVFARIREARPAQLCVVADGPRAEQPGEAELCAEARSVIEQVDWPCQVITNYADTNMGCKLRVSSGLDWGFSLVDEAIILEDDCLPHPTFFRFCQELLERYKYDTRIMTICGCNQLGEWKNSQQSYHFTYSGPIWGWATWKRAWQHYDVDMRLWQFKEVQDRIRDALADDDIFNVTATKYSRTYAGEINTWDYQWSFARLTQSALSITPSVNLVTNIGFSQQATHTRDENSPFANLPLHGMQFPLVHPQVIVVNREFDKKLFRLRNNSSNRRSMGYHKLAYRLILRIIEKLGKVVS